MFDDMIADMESNKKLSPIVYKLFLRGSLKTQKFHLFLHHNLISKSLKYKTKCNTLFIMKIPNKR